jgi:hypothetical protein
MSAPGRGDSIGLMQQSEPGNLEAPFEPMDSSLTPTKPFYTSSHFAAPNIDMA